MLNWPIDSVYANTISYIKRVAIGFMVKLIYGLDSSLTFYNLLFLSSSIRKKTERIGS